MTHRDKLEQARAPYGRQEARQAEAERAGKSQRPEQAERFGKAGRTDTRDVPVYDGTTYYDRPVLKPHHYGRLVSTYLFAGGLAGGAQLLAAVADVAGDERDRSIVRTGRYLGLAGAVLSPILLVADLHTPQRFLNMLRIFRPTSAMSIGSWILSAFGTLSGATALLQMLEDRSEGRRYRQLSRAVGVPAGIAGGMMTTYTGTLLGATSVPLWATADRLLPAMFACSGVSTASAMLVLSEQLHGRRNVARLEHVGLVAETAEAALAVMAERKWHQQGVHEVLDEPPVKAEYRWGFHAVGLIAPIAIHAAVMLSGRRSRGLSITAAVATVAGGYLMRRALVEAGRRSAERPRDYFRQSHQNVDSPEISRRDKEQPSVEYREPQVFARHQPAERLEDARASDAARQRAAATSDDVRTLCRDAIAALERALASKARDRQAEVLRSEILVARLRDVLIELRSSHRQDGSAKPEDASGQAECSSGLQAANQALSYIVSVEYPASGVNEQSLKAARGVLQRFLCD